MIHTEEGVKSRKWYAPKGQKLLAQGIALGVMHPKAKRPVRAKAFIINAFALTGRIIYNVHLPRAFLLRQAAEPSGPGLGEIWAFSPHCLSFDTLSFVFITSPTIIPV